jgi:hypothetical protein
VTNQNPFFIVGCVRSGTTILRDILRADEGLVCPEETHYYRWGDPFGTNPFINSVSKNAVIRKHRSIDGIDDAAFAEILGNADSRKSLLLGYMNAFKERKQSAKARWFDKTPQNIYGLALLVHDFPEASFIHIVRNPLNVSASLLEGKVMAAPSVVAAANYWNEAVSIFNTLRPLIKERCFEIRYEDLTLRPVEEAGKLADFLGIAAAPLTGKLKSVHPERDRYREVLKPPDAQIIADTCGKWAEHYGYDLDLVTKGETECSWTTRA